MSSLYYIHMLLKPSRMCSALVVNTLAQSDKFPWNGGCKRVTGRYVHYALPMYVPLWTAQIDS